MPSLNEQGSLGSVALLIPVFLGGLIGYLLGGRDRVAGAYRGFAVGLVVDALVFAYFYHAVSSYTKEHYEKHKRHHYHQHSSPPCQQQ